MKPSSDLIIIITDCICIGYRPSKRCFYPGQTLHEIHAKAQMARGLSDDDIRKAILSQNNSKSSEIDQLTAAFLKGLIDIMNVHIFIF